jgi:hypothetical protein
MNQTAANRTADIQNRLGDNKPKPANLEDASIAVQPLMQAQGQPEAEHVATIDITPVGLTTPEGQERVRIAMQKLENATALVANAASDLIARSGSRIAEALKGDPDAMEDLESLTELLARRNREQDHFLRALSGR